MFLEKSISKSRKTVEKWSNYTAFGQAMPGRKYVGSNYAYGFNGQLKDDEVSGSGNHTNFLERGYDNRIGRWWSIDPMTYRQPDWSPYKAFKNNPIIYNDPDGGTEFLTIISVYKNTGKTTSMVVKVSNDVFTDGIKHMVGDGACWFYQKNWYDKSTTIVITIDKKGKVTKQSSSKLLKDKVKATTSGPLINLSSYATMKSVLSESDTWLDNRMKKIAEETSKEYGGSPVHTKDPVTKPSSDYLGAWLNALKGEIGDVIVNVGTYVSGDDKSKASTPQQIQKAKQGDTLIEIYGDEEGNHWFSPSVKDTSESDGTRNIGGEATDKQVEKYGNPH